VPVEYWSIEAELRKKQEAEGKGQESFIAKLVKIRGKDPDLKNRTDAQAIVDDLEGEVYAVHKVARRDVRRNPLPPFMTSTLQQEASRKLRFTAKQTMAIAQALYEGKEIGGGERVGLITFMRTDSVQVAESAQAEARQWVAEHFGREYLPPQPPQYKTRAKGAQEAHEAIRPTSVQREPEGLKPFLTRDELRLYTLIWRRFVASQMAAAILDQTTVDILAGPAVGEKPYLFRVVGTVIKFPGFLKVYEESREEDEKGEVEGEGVRLPPLKEREALDLVRLLPKQHFTQPPPRYSDATLIRALEEYGIGRPSTYAPILTTLLERAYVERVDKKLIPTALGFAVNDLLVEYFGDVVNVGFTAEMEEKLDEIATGEQTWVPMLHEFYGPFSQTVVAAQEKMPRVELRPEPTGDLCPECSQPLLIRHGRNGKFIGCSGFPKCRYTAPLPIRGVTCPRCGGAVIEKRGRRGSRFYSCANWRPDDEPACQWTARKLPQEGGRTG
jgi:DNA topoisomerase-1